MSDEMTMNRTLRIHKFFSEIFMPRVQFVWWDTHSSKNIPTKMPHKFENPKISLH